MNITKLTKPIVKALPYMKTIAPVIFGGITGAAQAMSEQKAAARLDGMDDRIKELEKMLKK